MRILQRLRHPDAVRHLKKNTPKLEAFMDKIDNSERIDRFFREQMSLEERNTFLEDLKNDKELREEA